MKNFSDLSSNETISVVIIVYEIAKRKYEDKINDAVVRVLTIGDTTQYDKIEDEISEFVHNQISSCLNVTDTDDKLKEFSKTLTYKILCRMTI